jgi:hypothetical protein
MIGSAVFSQDAQYRYLLTRTWDKTKLGVCFVMLNPSKANATDSDNTIDRCITFAKSWGYGKIEVVNLFAYVSTDPKVLYTTQDPVGPENDRYIYDSLKTNEEIILGWGNIGKHQKRAQIFLNMFKDYKLKCLKKNKDGSPGHPLYLPKDVKPQLFW